VTLYLAAVAVIGIALGFLAGFTTFKRSLRWCQQCGRTLQCLNCLRVPSVRDQAPQR
jgi:hypothetical protein